MNERGVDNSLVHLPESVVVESRFGAVKAHADTSLYHVINSMLFFVVVVVVLELGLGSRAEEGIGGGQGEREAFLSQEKRKSSVFWARLSDDSRL